MMQPKQNGDGLGKDNVVGNRSSIQETKINTKEIMQKNSTKVVSLAARQTRPVILCACDDVFCLCYLSSWSVPIATE